MQFHEKISTDGHEHTVKQWENKHRFTDAFPEDLKIYSLSETRDTFEKAKAEILQGDSQTWTRETSLLGRSVSTRHQVYSPSPKEETSVRWNGMANGHLLEVKPGDSQQGYCQVKGYYPAECSGIFTAEIQRNENVKQFTNIGKDISSLLLNLMNNIDNNQIDE